MLLLYRPLQGLSDQIKKNAMGGACGTYGGREKGAYRPLLGTPEGKRSLEKPRRR
jgi:hypothetical protein